MDWHTAGRNWLDKEAGKLFEAWLLTKQGKKWKQSKKTKSPSEYGFHLPMWHNQAITLLDKNNEEGFKALKLQVLMSGGYYD